MNDSTFLFTAVMAVAWVAVVAAVSFTPFFIRKTIAFGVSVPDSEYHAPFLSRLRRRYCLATLLLGIVLGTGSMLSQVPLGAEQSAWVQTGAIFVYLAAEFAIYLVCYKKVRAYKRQSNWETSRTVTAPLTEGESGKKPIHGAWYLFHFAVAVVTAAVGIAVYPSLPDQLPMHYTAAGQVDSYAGKSWGVVFLFPAIQLLLALLFWGLHFAIVRTKSQPDAPGKTSGFRKSNAFKRTMDQCMCVIGLLTQLILCLPQLAMLGIVTQSLSLFLPLLILIPILVLVGVVTVRVGQGGSRLKPDPSEKEGSSTSVVEDDSVWKLGSFYVNRSDPSLFVEKRFGIGFTINFGNSKCWFIIGALVLGIAATLILPFILQ